MLEVHIAEEGSRKEATVKAALKRGCFMIWKDQCVEKEGVLYGKEWQDQRESYIIDTFRAHGVSCVANTWNKNKVEMD